MASKPIGSQGLIPVLDGWYGVLLILAGLILFMPMSFGQARPPLTLQNHSQDASDAFVVLKESKRTPPSAAELLSDILNDGTMEWKANQKSWGYSAATLWLYGSFFNPSDQTQERVLALPYASPTVADFFVFDQAGVLLKKVRAGTFAPLEERELKLNLIGIRLNLPPQERVHVLIRQHSNSLLDTHYSLRLVTDHQRLEWIYLAAYGLYFGLALALFFHNLSLYVSVRDNVYLAYLFFVLCLSSAMLFSSAYYSLFWYRTPVWLHNAPYATPAFSNIGAAAFFCQFLYLNPRTSWLARCLYALAGISLLSALGTFALPHVFMPWNPFLNTATVMLGMWGCIVKIAQKERYAWFLFIALLCPILSVSAYYLGNYLFRMTVPSDIMSLSFGLEMILMSAGLSHRIYVLRQRQYQWEVQQDALIHQSKMRALSEMASGMAHEINNPLMIIGGYADIIERLLGREPLDIQRIRENTRKISTSVDRIAYIVNALRSFAQPGSDLPVEKVSLYEMLQQALALYETQIRNNRIQLQMEIEGDSFQTYGVPSQLIQVISSLLDNAITAMRDVPRKVLRVHLMSRSVDSQRKVILMIQDSGPGIPRELQAKIFRPFFTTRPVGEGTGLSLSRARNLVKAFNGQLSYDANAEETRFILELPLIEGP
ncbi:sensor histidine kinase [Oligoflexus tunisiensis]|uniref:sensor histidine kinase n=1 Tax=Oligoflexus tunisiensis TaxID=708132 RepID=UPI00114D11DA|nr:7TM diverse intracellular signaling domain-containing protein [Oligoflexus tunisiensis]